MATHILIVEDEPEIRELLNFSLTRAGFRVTEAESGESALQQLFNQLPDLVIVDWMLPGMSGVDLTGPKEPMATHILIVEDEPEIRELLNFSLTRAGFRVTEAESGESALQQLFNQLPDLVIVDWMLPGMSGVDLAKRIRKDEVTSSLPLMMLTARNDEADVLKSFDTGIDDYMSKPFSPKELIARIKALMRRSGVPEDELIEASGIQIDLSSHRLIIQGQNVNIGPTEYRLLELLMRHPDRVFERDQLLDRIWGRSTYIEIRTVDVHILRLRKVLKPFGLDGTIQTVRSVGYRFTPIS